jgi:hypothetical protein
MDFHPSPPISPSFLHGHFFILWLSRRLFLDIEQPTNDVPFALSDSIDTPISLVPAASVSLLDYDSVISSGRRFRLYCSSVILVRERGMLFSPLI